MLSGGQDIVLNDSGLDGSARVVEPLFKALDRVDLQLYFQPGFQLTR